MKTLKRFASWLRNSKGVATSLVEVTATVAIGATLASVAVGSALDAIDNSKVQAAVADVSAIGQGIITFYKDNSFFPLFVNGRHNSVTDNFFGFLVSENGAYPTDNSLIASSGGGGATWDIQTNPLKWLAAGYFGDMPDYQPNGHASIEGHLVTNVLGNPVTSPSGAAGNFYPPRGSYVGDPQKGWAGPYVIALPKTDPWGDKYIVNVRNLHSGYLKTLSGSSSRLPKLAVIVLSAGPNRNIETRVDQSFDSFSAAGDDIVFRIK